MMNRRVEQVLRDHFPSMTDDQLEEMKTDDTGCYHDAFGDENVWMSPKMIYQLLRDLSDEYEVDLLLLEGLLTNIGGLEV